MLKIVAAVGVLTAVSSLCPHPAQADDPCTGDPGCPGFGHLVCEQMDKGLSSSQVAMNAMVAYGLDKMKAAWLVSGAIFKYRPWDEGN
jgi:hypothetical protein